MDVDHFDAVVRSLSVAAPRRGALGGLFGVGTASILTRLSGSEVSAKKRKKKCKGGKRKCGKKCILKTQCCVDTDCPTGATCISGDCVCPIGTTDCGDVCAILATDGANCGACGNACESNECVNGACTCSGAEDCPAGCSCVAREEGGAACATEPDDPQTCDDDGDCPLGTFCIGVLPIPVCSGVCQG